MEADKLSAGDETLHEASVAENKTILGKDEMNLAEFPLSVVSERSDPNQTSLTFEDEIWDQSREKMVTRRLTITGSPEYGLPAALDDEVVLGLIQLSKLGNFGERRVTFTRYQLIQLLGWRNESKSYERIEKSLKRWLGVSLYYKNAWWDKSANSWVNEDFHIIDNVTLYDREQAGGVTARQSFQSSFVWNDVMFRSFTAGNLRSIDFDFYRSLTGSIAKRLYRFLDKRFYLKPRWEFNLKEVSFEHIGLSRNYDSANIKRKLRPAIAELEERRFLSALSDEKRFVKVKSGEWRVVFEKAKQPLSESSRFALGIKPDENSGLYSELLKRGVSSATASATLRDYPADRISTQLEVFDWLAQQKDSKVLKNPAGFLIASIRSEYVPPKEFVTREQAGAAARAAEDRRAKEKARELRKQEAEHQKVDGKKRAAAEFWTSLSDNERVRLEAEALADADPTTRSIIDRGGPFAKSAREAKLQAYALQMLEGR